MLNVSADVLLLVHTLGDLGHCFSNLSFLKPLDATVDSGTGQQNK